MQTVAVQTFDYIATAAEFNDLIINTIQNADKNLEYQMSWSKPFYGNRQ